MIRLAADLGQRENLAPPEYRHEYEVAEGGDSLGLFFKRIDRYREEIDVAVFKYRAIDKNTEGYEEVGQVVAQDKNEAEQKLKRQGLKLVSLKRVQGVAALLARLTADIR